jgi:hypothetical protein
MTREKLPDVQRVAEIGGYIWRRREAGIFKSRGNLAHHRTPMQVERCRERCCRIIKTEIKDFLHRQNASMR